jgi:hypothetical protein
MAARFGPLDRCFLAVEALPAKSKQATRPLDGVQRALLPGLHGPAKRSPALIEFPLPVVGRTLALVDPAFTPVSFALALVGRTLARVSQRLALVGLDLAFIGRILARGMDPALVCPVLP